MNNKQLLTELEKRIINKQDLKIDLQNGIVLDLKWNETYNAYTGVDQNQNIEIGMWTPEVLIKIATEKDWNCKLIVD